MPCPSRRVIGSIVRRVMYAPLRRAGEDGFNRLGRRGRSRPGHPRATEQRTGQAEPIELPDRVRQAVEDPVDLPGLGRVDDRCERGHQPRPEVDDAIGRAVAADARRTGERALRGAPAPGRRTVARQPLLEQAQARVDRRHVLDPLEPAIRLIPRSRRHSSHTVDWPAPRTAPVGGRGAFPSSAAPRRPMTSAIRSVSADSQGRGSRPRPPGRASGRGGPSPEGGARPRVPASWSSDGRGRGCRWWGPRRRSPRARRRSAGWPAPGYTPRSRTSRTRRGSPTCAGVDGRAPRSRRCGSRPRTGSGRSTGRAARPGRRTWRRSPSARGRSRSGRRGRGSPRGG